MCLVHLENVRIILKMCLVHLENVRMIWKVSWQSKKCPDNLQNVLNYHYKCTPWSTFGPFLCLRSCKHTFYRHLSRIRKLTRFTRFIWKVFATKSCCPESFHSFWLWLAIWNAKHFSMFWVKFIQPENWMFRSAQHVAFYERASISKIWSESL